MRLIDAVKYRRMLEEEIAFSEENGIEERVHGLEIAVAGLMDAPTIDPETLRPTGRWVDRSDRGVICMTHPYVCNRCGRVEMLKEPYCNCGAKMEG